MQSVWTPRKVAMAAEIFDTQGYSDFRRIGTDQSSLPGLTRSSPGVTHVVAMLSQFHRNTH